MRVEGKGSIRKHLDFILIDIMCLIVAFFVAFVIRHSIGVRGDFLRMYAELFFILFISHFFIVYFTGFYSGIIKRGYFKEAQAILIQNLLLMAFVFVYTFVFQHDKDYSRVTVILFFVIFSVLMWITHTLRKVRLRKIMATRKKSDKLLIVARAEIAGRIIDRIIEAGDNDHEIVGVGIVGDDNIKYKKKSVRSFPVIGYNKDILEYTRSNVVDEVLLKLGAKDGELTDRYVSDFLSMGIPVNVATDIVPGEYPNMTLESIGGVGVVATSINTVSSVQIAVKRLTDIVAGLVGTIICGILVIFIGPAIKIADPKGGIFFKQQRVGKNGRTFNLYKFRSMYTDAEQRKAELMDKNEMQGLMFKMENDPRILGSGSDGTRKGIGHFIRSTSIDEFPNFWSILKGDMSLVGTRPPTVEEYRQYELHHKSRLAIKPGLTGMWQVSGRSDITDFEEVVRLDNYYIENWRLALDAKIILKTFAVVFKKEGSR